MLNSQTIDSNNNTNIIIGDDYLYNKAIHQYFINENFFCAYAEEQLDLDKIINDYKGSITACKKRYEDGCLSYKHISITLQENAFFIYEGGYGSSWYIATNNIDLTEELFHKVLSRYKPNVEDDKPYFSIIKHDNYFRTVKAYTDYNIANNQHFNTIYGADANQWTEEWFQTVSSNKKGLTILEGIPGTGKTTFIRHLINTYNKNFRFYYLPTNQFPLLNTPEAVDFWLSLDMQHATLDNETSMGVSSKSKPKVVILEDAENILMERASDNQQAVSNLLNISDGLMGDVLKIHFICTINCEPGKLDPALLRKGRLSKHREFKPLSLEAANLVASSNGITLDTTQESYTVAELFNKGCDSLTSNNMKVGFM
tara:strand:- start:192 stop:1301 length:1110 start_codon:yes stop_codon:yes gene_type:complete